MKVKAFSRVCGIQSRRRGFPPNLSHEFGRGGRGGSGDDPSGDGSRRVGLTLPPRPNPSEPVGTPCRHPTACPRLVMRAGHAEPDDSLGELPAAPTLALANGLAPGGATPLLLPPGPPVGDGELLLPPPNSG
jgi:hypothetical protein